MNASRFALLVLLASLALADPVAGAEPALEAFQRGLFEEEANRNPASAIEVYRGVLDQLEEQRQLAATVTFRLGECYRKLGKTNDAIATYQKLLQEFPQQTVLVKLAQQNLAGLGNPTTNTNAVGISNLPIPNMQELEIRRLERVLRDTPDLFDSSESGETPLCNAALNGYLDVARFLLDHGAGVNVPNAQKQTPLVVAAGRGQKTMVELLLDRGADVNAMTPFGSALTEAAAKGYVAVAEVLLKHGAAVNARSPRSEGLGGVSPLHIAIFQGHQRMVALLLQSGADVNQQNSGYGQSGLLIEGTPLHWAINRQNLELVELLLANHADPNLYSGEGNEEKGVTPLMAAASLGNDKIVAPLLRAGADVNLRAKSADVPGWMAIHFAANRGATEVLRLLLKNGANVDSIAERSANPQDRCNSYTPLLLIAMNAPANRLEVARVLFEAKAQANITNSCGRFPLLFALSQRDPNFTEVLLEHGASVEMRTPEGLVPLFIMQESEDLMQLLLKHGADPNATNSAGETLLHQLAARTRNMPPQLTVAGGTFGGVPIPAPHRGSAIGSPSSRNIPTRAIRTTAATSDSLPQPIRSAQLLIRHGADVNRRNAAGYTPLNYFGIPARTNGDTQQQLVDLLIENGAVDAASEPPSDPDSIRLWRSDRVEAPVVFEKDSKGRNQFTLLEALFNGRTSDFPFPDFAHLVIHRTVDGTATNIVVDLLSPTSGQVDCSKDVMLRFGDVVEEPMKEHALSEQWNSLLQAYPESVQCVYKKVTVRFREKEVVIEEKVLGFLTWLFQNKQPYALDKLLTTSADLSRVRVQRHDRVTGAQVEFVVDVLKSRPPEDLWLQDGDLIIVPEIGN